MISFYFLGICLLIGLISNAVARIAAPKNKYEMLSASEKRKYEELSALVKQKYHLLTNTYMTETLQKIERNQKLLDDILADKKQSCPTLAKVFADYEAVAADEVSSYLANKPHPAYTSAKLVKEFGNMNKALQQRNKELEYQLSFLENLLPWLEEFNELNIDEAITAATSENQEKEYDALRNWLSPQEYSSLSRVEKFQLALDRYRTRGNKSKWEIGIEYERYIGYCCECKSYQVEYRGALDGLQDMGRDLIVSDEKHKYVIQCKYWAAGKTIHEKHIFQLYGSVILLKLKNTDECNDVTGIFVTSTQLSDVARDVAAALNIKVYENIPMSYDYPCIKCNINRSTGERIYHLPFDQQYDRCIIKNTGEFYALTVQEAEKKGFRRAQKWYGNNF